MMICCLLVRLLILVVAVDCWLPGCVIVGLLVGCLAVLVFVGLCCLIDVVLVLCDLFGGFLHCLGWFAYCVVCLLQICLSCGLLVVWLVDTLVVLVGEPWLCLGWVVLRLVDWLLWLLFI